MYKIDKINRKSPVLDPPFYQKETPTQLFPVNFGKFLITASFIEYLWATASVNLYPLHRCFRYFPEKLNTIKYMYIIQTTDRCVLYNVQNNLIICTL